MLHTLPLLLTLLSTLPTFGAEPALVSSTYDSTTVAPKLAIERVMIWKPGAEWTYSHHPHLAFFKGRLFAIWSNGRKDEDAPGQRVMLSTTKDFREWTKPAPLVGPLPGRGEREVVLTAAGFREYRGRLTAYFGEYEADKTWTRLWAMTTTDGVKWGPVREMRIPVNPNFGPQATRSGRLIISGNISFPWTDDPSGLTGWTMGGIYPQDMAGMSDDPASFWRVQRRMGWPAGLCEGAFFQTDDGVIHMLLRTTGPGYRGKLWITESRDDGVTWSAPVETPFGDNDTKFHFGRLPDGRFYYVGCPDSRTRGMRSPLVLSLSVDGRVFDRHFIIADEHYERATEGLWKHGEYGYPHTIIHDGYMYVIVSRQKEAVEVLRFSLGQLP